MENKPASTAYIALTHHQLISCSAETYIKATVSKGGTIEFTTTMEIPDTSTLLKKGESYSIFVGLDCIGKSEETNDIAFKISSKMEGICTIANTSENGMKSSDIFWIVPVNQLYPLLSQFTSEVISRMGYKNIDIPPMMITAPIRKKLPSNKKIKK